MREHHKYFVIRLLADMKPILLEVGDDLAITGCDGTAGREPHRDYDAERRAGGGDA